MNELFFKNFDYKVLNNFHRVCRVREKNTSTDLSVDTTQLNYTKNSKRLVVGKTHYNTPSLICSYDTDFRFNKDLSINLYEFLILINKFQKKLPIITLEKDNNLHLKYSDTSMSNLSLNEEFSNEYEKRIPILDENKKDFSFKLNRDFFKEIQNKKLKLRHKFSFENTAFISDKKELSFTMYNDIDEKYGGLQSISFPISKLEKQFKIKLNSDQLKFLSNFFVSDYEVSSYENRKYLVFKNIYKPLKYFLFLTDKKLEPKPTPDSKESEIINHYAKNQKRND